MMKPAALQLALLVVVAAAFAACNPASDFASDEPVVVETDRASVRTSDEGGDATGRTVAGALPGADACPCFSQSSLSNHDRVLSAESGPASDYYLFFDVFNYYGLDARRTEARALVSTPTGLFEEVATVYITYASEDELFLICHRQEVVQHPVSGEPSYHYETLAPSVEQAESCRRAMYASVGDQEPCQGAACGIAYSKEQLDPDYPPYHDGNFRTPEALLDAMRQKVEAVGRMLQTPA